MANFDPSSATPVDATSPAALPAPMGGTFDPSSAQLVSDDSPSIGARALGLADAGLAGANQIVVGTGGSIARTVNRVLPEWIGGAGSKAQAESDINALQDRLTYHAQSDEGQAVGNAVSSAIAPVGRAVAGTVGAVAGNDNVPAVMDALSVLGLKGPTALAKGVLGTESQGVTAAIKAGRDADQAARDAGLGTAGLVSGNPVTQAAEQRLAAVPFVGSSIKKAIHESNTKLGLNSEEIVSNLTGGSDTSAQSVGKVVNDDVTKGLADARAASSKGYEDITNMLPEGAKIPVSQTRSILNSLTKIDGAQATAESVVPADIRSMASSLEKDAGLSGELPYEAVQKLRSAVGAKIDWSPLTSNPSNGMLKTVYGALTKDLNQGASSFGPDVAKAVTANTAAYAKSAAQREALQGVLNRAGGPEKVYNALFNTTKDGSSTLDAVLKYTSPGAQRLLAGSVLERMGRAAAGAQDVTGGVFSADKFLTEWNRMSPEARQSLFGSLPGDYAKSINDLAHNVSKLKTYGKVLGSRSHVFAPWISGGVTTAAILEGIAHGISGALNVKTLGAAGAAKSLGYMLTNPQTAKALARASGDLANNAVTNIARVYGANAPGSPVPAYGANGPAHYNAQTVQ